MNDFNKGIDYAFDYIEKHMYGYVVNGQLKAAVLREELEELKNQFLENVIFVQNHVSNRIAAQ